MELAFSPSLICDILCLVFFISVVLRYSHRGFLAGIVSLVGNFASVLSATFIARTYAGSLFTSFLRPGIVESISRSLSSESFRLTDVIDQYGGFLPESFRQKVLESVAALLDPAVPHAAEQVVAQVVEPLMIPFISMVLFFVAYTIFRFLVSMLVTVLTAANLIPLAGGINRSMGMVLGLLAGIIDLFLVFCAAWSLMAITGGKIPFLNEELFAGSLIFGLMGRLNPFI